ncbi:FadR/GntR family transcriptional regulator [Novosphingobium aquae]|jgi:GntR family transcriptional repressor for pyruvate dehydrogenase complex|uniref:FadR/GntR family transcriptional regulator n=1 Tax=Novosphingobium aquae TaxID=3133435 RepID=A0ABU8SDI4_9SPHN
MNPAGTSPLADTSPLAGSLVDQTIARIRSYIRANDLTVGSPLPSEGTFAAEFGVSRAVMREAFGALAALRQIDVANGRRARVAALDGLVMASSFDHGVATSQIKVSDVWDVRRALELRTVELAALNRTDEQAAGILAAVDEMSASHNDPVRLAAADIRLHQSIAMASGNPLYLQIVRSFGLLMDVAVPKAWQTRQTEQERIDMLNLHREIARTIAEGDADAAVKAMDRHFDASIGDMIKAQQDPA